MTSLRHATKCTRKSEMNKPSSTFACCMRFISKRIALVGGKLTGIQVQIRCFSDSAQVSARTSSSHSWSNDLPSREYSMYSAIWLHSCVPVMVTRRSLLLSVGSLILMTLPLSWRISLIFAPPLPMMAPTISLGMKICCVRGCMMH